jgi:membrane-associated HD superfamily phosphohydrolase
MLADGTEARVRAGRPSNEEELRDIVRSSIEFTLTSGQLDYTQLTLSDITKIADSFVTTLRGSFHPRIEYPKVKGPPAAEDVPTLPKSQPET